MPSLADLSALTEQLVSASVLVDPTDLTSLAELHTRLQAINQFAVAASAETQATSGSSLEAMSLAASSAEKILERIVLRDAGDGVAALQEVNRTILELQELVRAATDGQGREIPAPPPAPSPQSKATIDPHLPRPIEPECLINPDDLTLISDFIGEANTHLELAEGDLLRLEEEPQNTDLIGSLFRSFHTIKGVAGFLNLKQVGALAHATENLLDLAREGKLDLSGGRCDLVLESLDTMKSLVASLGEAVRQKTPIPMLTTLPDLLGRLHAGTTRLAEPAIQIEADPLTDGPSPPQKRGWEPFAARPAQAPAEATVKIATDRLDSLINMVGELVIAQSMVSQDTAVIADGNQRLARNMAHLGKITRELQDLSMSMRMVPIAGVFQKMARLVRDTARKINKDVEFVASGGETELDRNVVDAISDPLVHMVRNAVDHGIETPDVRQVSGKPRTGRIELRAYHQAGNIVIEITDDGKGLNKARLIKKATEAGILKEGQELSEQDIFRLIFHAGLSTAEKVTDVSGRGVGMDVVKKNVEALRGRIDIHSVEGKGSVFTIRLPLTLAVIDGLVVRVGRERYILPLTSVERSIQPTVSQLSTVQGRGEMLMFREKLVPMFRLYELFGVKPAFEDPASGLVVIVQDQERRCGLMVDDLIGQQQVVIKSLGPSLGHVPGIAGGAILGDGNISLILDVPELMALAKH